MYYRNDTEDLNENLNNIRHHNKHYENSSFDSGNYCKNMNYPMYCPCMKYPMMNKTYMMQQPIMFQYGQREYRNEDDSVEGYRYPYYGNWYNYYPPYFHPYYPPYYHPYYYGYYPMFSPFSFFGFY